MMFERQKENNSKRLYKDVVSPFHIHVHVLIVISKKKTWIFWKFPQLSYESYHKIISLPYLNI